MSTFKRIALAAGVVAAVSTHAANASATTPPTTTTPAVASPDFVMPPDYVQLTDDTGAITVAVPNTWTDVNTVPLTDAGGNTIPRISAATNYQVFKDTFDAPGVEYVALPFNADQQGLMTTHGLTAGCRKIEVEPYNDGAFIGLHGTWSDCGQSGRPEWHQLVVAPPDNSRTLVLQIQITSQAETPIVQNILDSFNTGSGVPPVNTVAAVPTVPPTGVAPTIVTPTFPPPTGAVPTVPTIPVPTVAVPTSAVPTPTAVTSTVLTPTSVVPTVQSQTAPTMPTSVGAVPPGFVQLVDASGTLSVVVPTTWTDVDTAAFVLDDGTQIPQIFASTSRTEWESSFTVPGVRLRQIAFIADSATFAADIGLDPGTCPTEAVEPFTNGRVTGHVARYAGCGSTAQTEYDVIVASPADRSLTYILEIQTTGPAEQAAAATAIASFGPNTGGPNTSGPNTTGPNTTGAVTMPTVVASTAAPGTVLPVPPGTNPTPTTAPRG